MTRIPGPRHTAVCASAVLFPLLFTACAGSFPNSTFTNLTEFNRDLTGLWNIMMGWGTFVFVLVEAILIYTIWRYRRRPNGPEPQHVHGNTAMEITWTIAPAIILVFIAVPTVRTIWKYGREAPANAVRIDVIGHQWWWEFRYPDYNIVTANEIYLPVNRPVSFSLRTADVIHSFWIPQLGGKRDLVTNRTNHLWFTPDSVGPMAFNGTCNEYCGSSHANMRFRAYTVTPEDFDRWVAHQQREAVFPGTVPASSTAGAAAMASVALQQPTAPPPAQAVDAFTFPRENLPPHVIPQTPVPAGLTIDDAVLANGDPQRGLELYSRSQCIACHAIRGNPMSRALTGPDLTHIASRHTIAAGLFPNDARHLALWIKNSRAMKPGVIMPTLGIGQYDPVTRTTVPESPAFLTDEQIADIVAYLMSLK